jgi:diphosphoinositol-polyphosphate diphosphatase
VFNRKIVKRLIIPAAIWNNVLKFSKFEDYLYSFFLESNINFFCRCVPYRYKKQEVNGVETQVIQVLLVSAQKGKGMLFPKGGWETDESMEEAALRETIEEAGVTGELEEKLGKWQYKSKRHSIIHDGYMFALLVSQEFERWPEAEMRQRRWVSLDEAREVCQNWWMREALEAFINLKCLADDDESGN